MVFEVPTESIPEENENLDYRRPRKLADVVGQDHIIQRLSLAFKKSIPSRLLLFVGPTGSGKTTLAQCTARAFLCRHCKQLGDACGSCSTCLRDDLSELSNFEEWTGAQLNDDWDWWREHGASILGRPTWCFILDEVQDLAPSHQKALFRQLEKAKALTIFATTHEHKLDDALVGRFSVNKFDVRRPNEEQAVGYMIQKCHQLGVEASPSQLAAVARHYHLNLRDCVNFVYAAKEQTADGKVTDEFVIIITGDDSVTAPATKRERPML